VNNGNDLSDYPVISDIVSQRGGTK